MCYVSTTGRGILSMFSLSKYPSYWLNVVFSLTHLVPLDFLFWSCLSLFHYFLLFLYSHPHSVFYLCLIPYVNLCKSTAFCSSSPSQCCEGRYSWIRSSILVQRILNQRGTTVLPEVRWECRIPHNATTGQVGYGPFQLSSRDIGTMTTTVSVTIICWKSDRFDW